MKKSTAVCGLVLTGLIGAASAAVYQSAGEQRTAFPSELLPATAAAPTTAKAVDANAAEPTATSDWARIVDGKLVYRESARGDHIMDFSSAGFGGGGVALPTNIPVRVTVSPSGGDDTAAIQQAVNTVSTMRLSRYRGVVKLAPGTFKISGTININASGVILAGSGSGTGGTIVEMTGPVGSLAFKVGASQAAQLTNTTTLAPVYIPSGANSVQLASLNGFSVGSRVMLERNVTAAWVQYVGMHNLTRDGQPQTWLTVGDTLETRRTITEINYGTNTVTFDGPVTDSFDPAYLGQTMGSVSLADYPGQISLVGIQDLQVKAPKGTATYSAVKMSNVINGFLSNVVGQETQNAFTIDRDVQAVTLDRVIVNNTTSQTAGAPNADFAITGTQIFLNNCASNAVGTWGMLTQAMGTGPIVLLNFKASNTKGVAPHQRWTTGLLADNMTSTNTAAADPGFAFRNRTNLGSGHGWTTGWSVGWNVVSPNLYMQAAAGSMNWCIGCTGTRQSASPSGTYSSQNVPVTPSSLYLQQLFERKGIAGLNAIGYSSINPNP